MIIRRSAKLVIFSSLLAVTKADVCRAMSSSLKATTLAQWALANEQKLLALPIDSEEDNFIRSNVQKAIFSRVSPTPFQSRPRLVCHSSDALEDLLDMDAALMVQDPAFTDWVSGNVVLKNSTPLAHRYGGYQFGYWANQLGDGRAILLGEYISSQGQRCELQLKGSGKTPFSRFGDGRAVLRSSIREFLCSEAMHHLGVPTSRAAALIVTDDTVLRDIFYNGNTKAEKCAVVLRLAPSWFRIGSLEILAKSSETEELNQLVDFILDNHFTEVKQESRDDWILAMFSSIVQSTAKMVAQWMSVGFTHGVLNTDNLSLLSITIDYGPFGFLDAFDPDFTPNHSDEDGRYQYDAQPAICKWNLGKLAAALTSIIPTSKRTQLQMILEGFDKTYEDEHRRLFRRKLGLVQANDHDGELINDLLLEAFAASGADFSQAFRDMSETRVDEWLLAEADDKKWGLKQLLAVKTFKVFVEAYKKRLESEELTEHERMVLMQSVNPRYVLRNWMAQSTIERAERDDFSGVQLLHKVLKAPFELQDEAEKAGFASPVPSWSKKLVVSCSS